MFPPSPHDGSPSSTTLREFSAIDLLPLVPDTAQNLELRGLLERGGSAIGMDAADCVVWHADHALLATRGRAQPAAVSAILERHAGAAALLVPNGTEHRYGHVVGDWEPTPMLRLLLPRRLARATGGGPRAAWFEERHACALDTLPPSARDELESAAATGRLAVSLAGRRIASWCHGAWETALHCDLSVHTLSGHRRRGHAAACCRLWISEALRLGRHVQWVSEADNDASIGLARSLGFEPLETVVVLRRPSDG